MLSTNLNILTGMNNAAMICRSRTGCLTGFAPTWIVPNKSRRYAGIVANPPPYMLKMITQTATKNNVFPV